MEQVPPTSYNGQGSIQTMNELYEVGDVIGTGTFGIIRKVSRGPAAGSTARSTLNFIHLPAHHTTPGTTTPL